MDTTRPSAPADHFSPERAYLTELSVRLRSLQKALPLMHRMAGGAHHGLMSACAAVVAYLPTQPLGLKEGFWSAMTAIAVVQTEFRATETTARDQFIGAAIGGVTALCAYIAFGQHLIVYAAAVVVAMLACWALNIASASRLAGTTTTIILLVPHAGSPASMFGSRLAEVAWGVSVAVVTVWVAARLPARHLLPGPRPEQRAPPKS
jgi:uncharacterized membrane protein YgaE (UPF0421/DUF939 family)